jgi:hypothetical protein
LLPLPYPAPFCVLLYGLLGLDVALLAGGLAMGRYSAAHMGHLPLPLRMSLSAILVAAALLQWQLVSGTALAGYGRWIFLGMALGFVGDLVMAGLIPTPDRLICGMLAFGLGHVVYVVAFAGAGATLGLASAELNLGLLAPVGLLSVGLWYGLVRKPGGDRRQNLAALVYSLLMATMNTIAISLAIRQIRFLPLAVGAALFLTSDLLIGNWSIRGHAWKGVNDAVWITYNLGQLLIVFSVSAAANALVAH